MYDILYGNIVSCSTATKMSPSLPPPERAVPIVTIVATDNVQECGEHRFGCSNTLMLAWNARGFGGLLRRQRSGFGQTHHLSQRRERLLEDFSF